MGVPQFFRWLSRKYAQILVYCHEETVTKDEDGNVIPMDTSGPNPNNIEFDNLYLDMNGIIHPCCHPEDRPAPKNEAEMMIAIFAYMDRLFAIVRPRRLLYMAIDGVAPRAKMNQQRSRRFRASKELAEKQASIDKVRSDLESQGIPVPPKKADSEQFDSNCITPGTPFMTHLSECLRYYIHDRLNSDPGWKNIEVILSDANVPGEGEHKIMDFIRKQRASPSHDPNTHHCLCGADADLIMLGLATHEPNFTIIREEFIPYHVRPCDLCGQYGHELKDCQGTDRENDDFDETPLHRETNFIFIRLCVLREYLEKDLAMDSLPFPYDLERAIDDWVFMCFFVGNDFLPHLPSLEIRENAIDRLVDLYKKAVYQTGGWLTDSGIVHLDRVQLIVSELGAREDEIFKGRQQLEEARAEKDKQRKLQKQHQDSGPPAWALEGRLAPVALGQKQFGRKYDVGNGKDFATNSNNADAAKQLKAMLKPAATDSNAAANGQPNSTQSRKRKHEEIEEEEEEENNDEIRLWEEGWKERYYQAKFEVSANNLAFRYEVAYKYVEGLCWVLRYYYQGVPSWKWFYPYHYAPFASDFINVGDFKIDFDVETKPFNPLEQLMGVFPAASCRHIPDPWAELMLNPNSEILDFYPDDFKVDLNGKKYLWQGVALLPFVDETRLLDALAEVYDKLTPEEVERNGRSHDRMFVGKYHKAFTFFCDLYSDAKGLEWTEIEPTFTYGMAGQVKQDEGAVLPGKTLRSPFVELKHIENNQSICVASRDPQFPHNFLFMARRLEGAKDPERVVVDRRYSNNARGRDWDRGPHNRPQTGFSKNIPRAELGQAGHRMLNSSLHEVNQANAQWDYSYGQARPISAPQYSGYGNGQHYQQQQQHYGNQSYGYGGQQQQQGQSNYYNNQQQSYGGAQQFANPYQNFPTAPTGGYWGPPQAQQNQPRDPRSNSQQRMNYYNRQ